MTEIIYGGIGVIALICGGLWRLHRNQLATENNHDQIAERVYRMEQTLHGIEKKVVAMDAKFDQVLDILKQK